MASSPANWMDGLGGNTSDWMFMSPTNTGNSKDGIVVSGHQLNILEIVIYIVFSGAFGILGIIANCLNIAVFVKQGLQESAQVSLFCLSVSDLGISFLTVVASTNAAIDKLAPDIPVDMKGVHLAVSGYPLSYCSRISMVTTMVLCTERCLCVIRPLTVRNIITRKRTIICLALFYLEITGFYMTYFCFVSLVWKFDETRNTTRLKLERNKLMPKLQQANHIVNSTILTLLCVFVVLLASIVMVIGVRRASSTRSKLTATKASSEGAEENAEGGLSLRDARLVKMVVYVAILFLGSFLPVLAMDFVKAFIEPELHIFGKYRNINEVMWSVITACGALNASLNIFIYYVVSERYRKYFRAMICKEPL